MENPSFLAELLTPESSRWVVLGGNRTQSVDFERFRPCEGAHQRAYRCPNRSHLTGLATKGPRGVNMTDIIGRAIIG